MRRDYTYYPTRSLPSREGMQRRARNGTHRANQLGLPTKCSLNKFSRYLRTYKALRFDHELASRVGMRAGSGRATARIRGIAGASTTCRIFAVDLIPIGLTCIHPGKLSSSAAAPPNLLEWQATRSFSVNHGSVRGLYQAGVGR